MKKIYLLITLLAASFNFAQTPVITMIADGDESGGTPKVLEIYANGTVDFSQYSLQNQTNTNTSWGNTFDLSPLGTVTDDFVYIYYDGDLGGQSAFAVNFPSAVNTLDASSSSVLSINGNDRVRIIETSTTAVVDVYGVDGLDGSGEVWEYTDGYAKRLPGTNTNPVFDVNNWEFHTGELNGHGAVQDGTTYESIIGIGTYTPPTTLNPAITITSPTPNQLFSPSTDAVDIVFTVQDFTVAAAGAGDGYIKFSVNGGTYTDQYDTNPIHIDGLSPMTYTVEVKLVDNSGNDLNPPVSDTVDFEIADYVQVATLADLRASAQDAYYHYTGEAYLTAFKVTSSNNVIAYLQDSSAAIAVYVPSAYLPGTPPALYDGISDLKGKLIDYNGMLEVSVTDTYTATGNNQPVTPEVITIADYLNNQDNYEAELIKIENVNIDPDGDTEFQLDHSYTITDGTDSLTLRTAFPDIENQTIPTTEVNVTGIGGQYNQYLQIMPRDINDIEEVGAIAANNIDGLQVYPNPVTGQVVYVSSDKDVSKQISIYSVLGKLVLSVEVNNAQAIDLGQLKAGVYMMKIEENGHIAIQKLMVK